MFESVRSIIKQFHNIYYASSLLFETVFLHSQSLNGLVQYIYINKLFYKQKKPDPTVNLIWNARNEQDKEDNKLPNFLFNFFPNFDQTVDNMV